MSGFMLLVAIMPATAQSATPSPTPAATSAATQSVTGTPVDPQSVYTYAPLPSGQQTAVIYTFTAGELLIASLLFAIVIILLFMAYLVVSRAQ
jgi:hypothetical protein